MFRKLGVPTVGLLLIFLSSTGLSFTWNSFRNQSTAGLLDDDYDLLLDPARLPLIEGSRVYTSLANLVDKNEEFFSDTDNGYWLVGGSTKLGEKVFPGLVHDRFSLKTPQDFTLFALDGQPQDFTGEGELLDCRFTDLDTNGVYDTKETQHQTAQGWDEENSADYYVAIGSYLGDTRFGFFYHFSDWSYEFLDPGRNFTLTKTDTNLIDTLCTYDDDQASTGDILDQTDSHQFGLAAWIPTGEQLLLGGRFSYATLSMEDNTTWHFTETMDRSPENQQVVDTYNQDQASTETVPRSGSVLSGGLRSIYNWTEDVETWLDLTLERLSGEITGDAGFDYYLFDEWRITRGPADSVYSDTNRTTADISGDFSENAMDVFTRTIARLSDKVTFGIGLGLETGNFESATTRDENRVDQLFVDNGDAQQNDPNDFTETVVDTTVESDRTTGSNFTLSFPVGVEIQIKNPLVLRLGARHDITLTDRTTTLTRKVSAEHHRVDRGDGTWNEWIDPPVSTPIPGESETVKETVSETHYYYGLGWQVTDNVQIDLMGFSELLDLSGWRVSVVVELPY